MLRNAIGGGGYESVQISITWVYCLMLQGGGPLFIKKTYVTLEWPPSVITDKHANLCHGVTRSTYMFGSALLGLNGSQCGCMMEQNLIIIGIRMEGNRLLDIKQRNNWESITQ